MAGMALGMARIETIISGSKIHRNTNRMHNLKHGLLEPRTLISIGVYTCIGLVKKKNHITYKKHEELHKARVRQMREQGEYTELHHVSTSQGHADCHQNQDATHRPNNNYAKT